MSEPVTAWGKSTGTRQETELFFYSPHYFYYKHRFIQISYSFIICLNELFLSLLVVLGVVYDAAMCQLCIDKLLVLYKKHAQKLFLIMVILIKQGSSAEVVD